jgi:hypothetical protein
MGLDQLDFGEVAAERPSEYDFLFKRHGFVETRPFRRLNSEHFRFAIARKGAGKTATAAAIAKRAHDQNELICDFSLTTFEPSTFFGLVDAIKTKLTVTSDARLCRNLWRFAIGISMMAQLRDSGTINSRLRADPELRPSLAHVLEYLEQNGFVGEERRDRSLEKCAEHALRRIDAFLKNQLATDAAEYFPTDDSYRKAEEQLKKLLPAATGTLIVIDDFDRWIEASTYGRMAPLIEGLLQAAGELEDYFAAARFRLRAFIPEDLFEKVKFRHQDKETHSLYLRWDTSALKEMLARRVATQLNIRISGNTLGGLSQDQINHVFSRVFANWTPQRPHYVYDYWGQQHDAVAYLIMHTLHRPRDLYVIVNHMRELALSEDRNAVEFTDHHILTAVPRACEQLAEVILLEYNDRMPLLRDMVYQFQSGPSVRGYVSVTTAISKVIGSSSAGEVQSWLKDLYEVGFIGRIVKAPTPAAQPRPVQLHQGDERLFAEFSFARAVPRFSSGDRYLIHPVFWSALDIELSQDVGIRGFTEPSAKV